MSASDQGPGDDGPGDHGPGDPGEGGDEGDESWRPPEPDWRSDEPDEGTFSQESTGGEHPGGEDGHDHDEDSSTPEEDYEVARTELAKGEFEHAAFHLGAALAHDPVRPEWVGLLDQLLDAAPDPLAVAPLEEPVYFGTAAVHAYALARKGRLEDALRLLDSVLEARPDVPYGRWALQWLREPGAVERVDPELLYGFFGRLVQTEDPDLEEALPIVDRARAARPKEPLVHLLAAALLRRLERYDEALARANEAERLEPSWRTAVAVALIHRSQGDVEKALASYRTALERDPEDVSAHLDAGDLLLENGRVEEGARHYQTVLDREPEHPWALPSLYYAKHVLTGEREWFEKLEGLAREDEDNERAHVLARALSPYLGWLPEPREATINVLRKLLADPERPKPLTGSLTVSALEPPSVTLVLDELREKGDLGELAVQVDAIPSPDPRTPRGPVEFLLWRYEGTTPFREVSKPAPEVAEAVAGIAEEPFLLDAWWEHAAMIATELGTEQLSDLLGVMVHPPRTPEDQVPWVWIPRVQLAAALCVARIDEGWRGSLRRNALLAITRGPVDWVVSAAIVALGRIALDEPAARADVNAAFRALAEAMPRPGHCCYEGALVATWSRLPDLPPELAEELKAWRARLDGESE